MSQVNLWLKEYAPPSWAWGSIQTPGRYLSAITKPILRQGRTPAIRPSFAMTLPLLENLLGGMTGALLTSMVGTGCLHTCDMTWYHSGWSGPAYSCPGGRGPPGFVPILRKHEYTSAEALPDIEVALLHALQPPGKGTCSFSRPTQSLVSTNQTTQVRTTCPLRKRPLSGLQYRCLHHLTPVINITQAKSIFFFLWGTIPRQDTCLPLCCTMWWKL